MPLWLDEEPLLNVHLFWK